MRFSEPGFIHSLSMDLLSSGQGSGVSCEPNRPRPCPRRVGIYCLSMKAQSIPSESQGLSCHRSNLAFSLSTFLPRHSPSPLVVLAFFPTSPLLGKSFSCVSTCPHPVHSFCRFVSHSLVLPHPTVGRRTLPPLNSLLSRAHCPLLLHSVPSTS